MKAQQRTSLRTLAVVAATIGVGAVLFPGIGARAVGMPGDGRAAWGLRLFGVRELCLALGLLRAARAGDGGQGRLMADLVTAVQIGDAAVALLMFAAGRLSRRGLAIVLAGVPPTLAATRAARGARST
ncbi:MAG: hypothetical protein NVS9B1_11990 [Candidatus Dormibacteraceae bacterium]